MPVVISLLRGINVGGHHAIKMDALRDIYKSLRLHNPRSYIQSGNILFETEETDLATQSRLIEDEIERIYHFRPSVIQRTALELEKVIAENPFAGRTDIPPNKLVAVFFAQEPGPVAVGKTIPEEVVLLGREMYIYFPTGMGTSKLKIPVQGTARNWNTVTKLLELAANRKAV